MSGDIPLFSLYIGVSSH